MNKLKMTYFIILLILFVISASITIPIFFDYQSLPDSPMNLEGANPIKLSSFLVTYLSCIDPQLIERESVINPQKTIDQLRDVEEENAHELTSLISIDCEIIFNLADGSHRKLNREKFIQFVRESYYKDKRHYLWLEPTTREIKTVNGLAYMYWRDAVIYANKIETLQTRLTVSSSGNQQPQIIKLKRTYNKTTEAERKMILDLLSLQSYQPTF